ncbi:MAG: hypothetical protein D6729_10670 [Deltaproteobacteria bacterium]|nr:MAG: hypothetical protein D6729_10670 [Deltaproteobacteria bacterium]
MKAVPLRVPSYERLEKAVGLTLFAALECAVEATIGGLRGRRFDFDLSRTWLLVRTAIHPLLFVSIRSRALQNDLNPWEISGAAAEILEPVYEEVLAEGTPDPMRLETKLRSALWERLKARKATIRSGLLAELRERTLDFLLRFDDGRSEWMRLLAATVRRDSELEAAYLAPKARRAILERLRAFGRGRLDEGMERHGALTAALEALEAGDPERAPCAGLPAPEALFARGCRAYVVYCLDRYGAARLDEALARLRHARDEEEPGDLEERWESGRLYRFAADDRPILHALKQRREGQLFVDLKGYTRRTHRAKEVVMADFMRHHFYAPILASAKQRMATLAYGGGSETPIRLHNLLGDAAAFAGQMPLLIELAQDLERIGRAYEAELLRASPTLAAEGAGAADLPDPEDPALAEEAAATLREVEQLRREMAGLRALSLPEKEARFDEWAMRRLARIEQQITEAQTQLREQPAAPQAAAELERLHAARAELLEQVDRTREILSRLDPEARAQKLDTLLTEEHDRRLRALEGQLSRLEEAQALRRRAAEDAAREAEGRGLETGIYIAYGSAAEVVRFEDEVYGTLRVAISEKINEAARGTARSAAVRARLEAALRAERLARGNPDLKWPFRVHVDSAWALSMPDAVGRYIEAALEHGDRGAAIAAARALGQSLLEELSLRQRAEESGGLLQAVSDIYNVGIALSADALNAYLLQTASNRIHFVQSVHVDELAPEVREPFAFPEPELSLVVSIAATGDPSQDVQIFRFAGSVQFRGFEAARPQGVYELLAPESRFVQALQRHHLAAWIREMRADPARTITRLFNEP